MTDQSNRPEWVPAEGGDAFTTHVTPGVAGGHDGMSTAPRQAAGGAPRPQRRRLTTDEHVQGVLEGNRTILARTITLVESNAQAHIEHGQEVLRQLMPHTGDSIRVGITGVPGVGKSTFIEALGCLLCDRGHRVAVLAVDPSSSVTRGSILGDKTRMERLTRRPEAFIRPSPSAGTLGGVARKSRETILVCEAAGFDVILVETMGVGQSEITVRSMVDFFMLLMLTGAGDELQGIKKGVIEMADALLINKADGDNKVRAQAAQADYKQALHYLAPATAGWHPQVQTCSALTGEGIGAAWDMIEQFRETTTESGVFAERRRAQTLDWVTTLIEEYLRTSFFQHPAVVEQIPQIKAAVADGTMPATAAAQALVRVFEER
ncbi:MAG: methylmalonyl Co-A mutase-associated GTPase MeaB [Chloroflexota bacterium]